MTDDVRISRCIDALVIAPSDDDQSRSAAVNVCAVMSRAGDTVEQIREVLAALGLLGSGRPERRPSLRPE